MTNLVDEILSDTDDILGLRDELGAGKHDVYILTRKWSESLGKGFATDSIEKLYPTPFITDYSHDLRIRENGMIKQGDLNLKHISKQSYPDESMIDCTVSDPATTEKFYYINSRLYTITSIVGSYVYWNVMVRKAAKQKVYL